MIIETDEGARRLCHGMPAGFASPCGIILEPHGPHMLEEGRWVTDRETGRLRRTVYDLSEAIDGATDEQRRRVLHFLAGHSPAAVDAAMRWLEVALKKGRIDAAQG